MNIDLKRGFIPLSKIPSPIYVQVLGELALTGSVREFLQITKLTQSDLTATGIVQELGRMEVLKLKTIMSC
jgi:hypothetical protein